MPDEGSENEFLARYFSGLRQERANKLEENSDLIHSFVDWCARTKIRLAPTDFDYIQTIGIVAKSPGLLSRLIGNKPIESDGLRSFKRLLEHFSMENCGNGYLRSENYMAMAHPHFRRGFSGISNYAPRFIEKFWQSKLKNTDSFIALDEDCVRIDVEGPSYFEEDTWYGAKFSRDVASIPLGLTKLRPPLDLSTPLISLFFANAHTLDVKWSQEGDIKTFQALELKTDSVRLETDASHIHPARYIHAEYDLNVGAFRHFDGAVQCFSPADYLGRRESDFNYNFKQLKQIKAPSKKLFKFNGRIELDNFVELCCHFLTGNPLAFEYFEGSYPKHVVDAVEKMRNRI